MQEEKAIELYYLGHHEINHHPTAGIVFGDRSLLLLLPQVKHDHVEGVQDIILYQERQMQSWVTSHNYQFWSRGPITQPMMADYLEAALSRVKLFSDEELYAKPSWLVWRLVTGANPVREKLQVDSLKKFERYEPSLFPDRI